MVLSTLSPQIARDVSGEGRETVKQSRFSFAEGHRGEGSTASRASNITEFVVRLFTFHHH
jgi:hypothetical protein